MMRPVKNNSPAAAIKHVSRDAIWKGRQLFLGRKLLATVVPDADWPGMWRVKLPSGRVTDMVNLSRAKDAAVCLACAAEPPAPSQF
jgi:hypothetical protein